MILDTILLTVLTLAVASLTWQLWTIRRSVQLFMQQMQTQHKAVEPYQALHTQVGELNEAMEGVQTSLLAVEDQVQQINQFTSDVLETSLEDSGETESGDALIPTKRVLIEIRHRPMHAQGNDFGDARYYNDEPEEDDMPPEMWERYKTFRAIYETVVDKGRLPSRKRPDLN